MDNFPALVVSPALHVESEQRIVGIARPVVGGGAGVDCFLVVRDGGVILLLFLIKGPAQAVSVGHATLAQRIQRHFLRVLSDRLVEFAGRLMDQAEHVSRQMVPGVPLDRLLEVGDCRVEPSLPGGICAHRHAVHYCLQGGPFVIGLPPAEIGLRVGGVECYRVVMVLDGKAEQTAVFIGGG
jgi:hypothetical protein